MKPYQPQVKKLQVEHLLQDNHMQTAKKSNNTDNLAQSRPKRAIKPKINWIYKELCNYLVIRLDITCFLLCTYKWLPNRG